MNENKFFKSIGEVLCRKQVDRHDSAAGHVSLAKCLFPCFIWILVWTIKYITLNYHHSDGNLFQQNSSPLPDIEVFLFIEVEYSFFHPIQSAMLLFSPPNFIVYIIKS